jgi:hypothetical protein
MIDSGCNKVTTKHVQRAYTNGLSSEAIRQRTHTQRLTALIFVLLFFNIVCLFLYHGQLSKVDGYSNIVSSSHYKSNPSLVSNKRNKTSSESKSTKNAVLEYFNEARVKLHEGDLQSLPTWSQIESIIGKEPVILGFDRCEIYRRQVSPLKRMLGASGMFNSGTNLVS